MATLHPAVAAREQAAQARQRRQPTQAVRADKRRLRVGCDRRPLTIYRPRSRGFEEQRFTSPKKHFRYLARLHLEKRKREITDRDLADLAENTPGKRLAEPVETDSNDEPEADANGDSDDEREDENEAVPETS